MIQIGTKRGYTLFYDYRNKLFILKNAEGDEVASGATQDELETKAEKLSKQAFKFPIPALRAGHLHLEKGRITSFNADDLSAYFSYDDKGEGGHTKIRLRYDHAYKLTEANSQIYEQVVKCRHQIKEIEGKMENLIHQLEKPMDLPYFGLKESR